ncbi:MAG: hypothetical protein Kow0075_11230 [Salibacteraceae bacterium]
MLKRLKEAVLSNYPTIGLLLTTLLAGFAMLPPGLTSITAFALTVFSLRQSVSLKYLHLLLIIPGLVLLFSWVLHGLAPAGLNEIKLWLFAPAAIIIMQEKSRATVFMKMFMYWSVTEVVICIAYLALHVQTNELSDAGLIRNSLSERFGVHPTYLSMIWVWAAAVAYMLMGQAPFRAFVVCVVLLFGAALAGGKTPLIASAVVVPLSAFVFSAKRKKLTALMALIAALAIPFTTPTMTHRWQELKHGIESKSSDSPNSVSLRRGIWQCSAQIIAEHPLSGVGVGNTRAELENCYVDFQKTAYFLTEYNSHNQWLHFAISSGVPLAVLSLVCFLAIGFAAWQSGSWELLLLTVYWLMISQTENYISRQTGILFLLLHACAAIALAKPNKGKSVIARFFNRSILLFR